MTVLHIWAIAIGAAALALPVVVHWLTRPRPQRMELSTVRFVQQVLQQKRARSRLRDWLILALRTAAVCLIAAAFARPLFGRQPLIQPSPPGRCARVVLLDQSLSMGATAGGISAFERARNRAAEFLAYNPDLTANLVLASAQPRPALDGFSSNFVALRDELAKAAVRPERCNAAEAIRQAAVLLAEAGPANRRELIIVSDMQRANWSAADFSPLPQGTLIQFESVAPEQPLANVGILRAALRGRLEQGREARLEIEIGNYSPAAREVQVEVSLGNGSYRLSGLCAAQGRAVLATNVMLRDSGFLAGQAKLAGIEDALKADDSRPLVVDVRPAPTYALVTRQSSQPRPVSSHMLERALTPFADRSGGDSRRIVRVEPSAFEREALAGAELIVLDHPGRLSEDQVRLLAALLRRGRGVLYIASEPADATNLKLLMDAAGRDLQMPVEFLPAQSPRRNLFWVEYRRDEAPFSIFGAEAAGVIGPLRFGGGLDSKPLPGGLPDEVLATCSDRSAGLVVTACGAGTLAVLNADLGDSNLSRAECFVPLLWEIVGRLLTERGLRESATCGERVDVPIDNPSAAGLTLLADTQGADDLGQLLEDNAQVVWHWGAAGSPGVYRVKKEERTLAAIATAAPEVESDLAPLAASVLTDRLAAGRPVHVQSANQQQQETSQRTWAWLAAGAVLCLLLEVVALRAFQT